MGRHQGILGPPSCPGGARMTAILVPSLLTRYKPPAYRSWTASRAMSSHGPCPWIGCKLQRQKQQHVLAQERPWERGYFGLGAPFCKVDFPASILLFWLNEQLCVQSCFRRFKRRPLPKSFHEEILWFLKALTAGLLRAKGLTEEWYLERLCLNTLVALMSMQLMVSQEQHPPKYIAVLSWLKVMGELCGGSWL